MNLDTQTRGLLQASAICFAGALIEYLGEGAVEMLGNIVWGLGMLALGYVAPVMKLFWFIEKPAPHGMETSGDSGISSDGNIRLIVQTSLGSQVSQSCFIVSPETGKLIDGYAIDPRSSSKIEGSRIQ